MLFKLVSDPSGKYFAPDPAKPREPARRVAIQVVSSDKGPFASEEDYVQKLGISVAGVVVAAEKTIADKITGVFNDLPEQVRNGFAGDFAVVTVLIERKQFDLAKAYIASKQVPAELEPLKQQMLAAFSE